MLYQASVSVLLVGDLRDGTVVGSREEVSLVSSVTREE